MAQIQTDSGNGSANIDDGANSLGELRKKAK